MSRRHFLDEHHAHTAIGHYGSRASVLCLALGDDSYCGCPAWPGSRPKRCLPYVNLLIAVVNWSARDN